MSTFRTNPPLCSVQHQRGGGHEPVADAEHKLGNTGKFLILLCEHRLEFGHGEAKRVNIGKDDLENLLGPRKFKTDVLSKIDPTMNWFRQTLP